MFKTYFVRHKSLTQWFLTPFYSLAPDVLQLLNWLHEKVTCKMKSSARSVSMVEKISLDLGRAPLGAAQEPAEKIKNVEKMCRLYEALI